MLINADFSSRAVVLPDQYRWVASPQLGVERMMLDRVGGEQARATSIVRYAANSYFPSHQHPGGEEIFVLSGTFSDEGGHYPAGWYLRNPPNSIHQPFSADGAMIFVKLGQMLPSDDRHVRIDTRDPTSWYHDNGQDVCPLFSGESEEVSLQRLTAGQTLAHEFECSREVLVLEREVLVEGQAYPRGSWLRLPRGESMVITAGQQGATVYLKVGRTASISTRAE